MTEPAKLGELDLSEAKRIVERAALTDSDRKLLLAVIEMLVFVASVLETKRVTIARLRKLIFGAGTEKTSRVCGGEQKRAAEKEAKALARGDKPKRKGHGRNPASHFRGATKIRVAHPTLRPGDCCPNCTRGKLRELALPARLVRTRGQAPITGERYELQRLRCNTCGDVFKANPPPGVGEQKYDVTVAVMIALLRYGYGLPFNRLARMQSAFGIPLSASTQWDIVSNHLAGPEAAYDELIRQAAQGTVVHNDDTTVKVLELMRGNSPDNSTPSSPDNSTPSSNKPPPERKGMFTSGIVALAADQRIALFFTGRKHAGENLADVLRHRSGSLDPPIHMCDGLSRNLPAEFATVLANCLAHSRRQYVDVFDNFPDPCRHVLEVLRDVYRNDAITREATMSSEERLDFHKQHSQPLMIKLEHWLHQQFEDKLVEPNSSLGEAIGYMLAHWFALTQFLRVPGAPLDNNICERALKKAILHRKNSLFFRTEHGAHVGDIFMSLIHTAELCGADPFDYLRALMRHPKEVAARPSEWLPWSYRAEIAVAAEGDRASLSELRKVG
jgi:transposase